MRRAFGQPKDEWAADNGYMTEADGAARRDDMEGRITEVEAEAASAAEEARDKLEQTRQASATDQQAVADRNQELADQLGLRSAKSAAEAKEFREAHDPGGPQTSQEAQAELDGIADGSLSIYEEYINPEDDTFGKQDSEYIESVTIDPTSGLSNLSDEALAKAIDYDPYADFADPKDDTSIDESTRSTAGYTKASVVHIDMGLLRRLANRCAQINEAFQKGTANNQQDAWDAGTRNCSGYSGAATDVVHTFYTNWKIRRGKIRESAEAYGKNARIVIQNFTRLDTEIAAKAMRQRAVMLESKRRSLAAAEAAPKPEAAAPIAPPVLELTQDDVEFIGMKNGITLTGDLIGAKLALQVDGAWTPYATAVDGDFATGDYTPDGTFSTPDCGDLNEVEEDLRAASPCEIDVTRLDPAEMSARIVHLAGHAHGAGTDAAPLPATELVALARELFVRRGNRGDAAPDGSMHIVTAGPRGFAPPRLD